MALRRAFPSPWTVLLLSLVVTASIALVEHSSQRQHVLVGFRTAQAAPASPLASHSKTTAGITPAHVTWGSPARTKSPSFAHSAKGATTVQVHGTGIQVVHTVNTPVAGAHPSTTPAVAPLITPTTSTSTTTTVVSVSSTRSAVASTLGYVTSPDAVEATYAISPTTPSIAATISLHRAGSVRATLTCPTSSQSALVTSASTLVLDHPGGSCTLTIAAVDTGTTSYEITTTGTFA